MLQHILNAPSAAIPIAFGSSAGWLAATILQVHWNNCFGSTTKTLFWYRILFKWLSVYKWKSDKIIIIDNQFLIFFQESVIGDSSLHLAAGAGDDDMLRCLVQYLKESGQVGWHQNAQICKLHCHKSNDWWSCTQCLVPTMPVFWCIQQA